MKKIRWGIIGTGNIASQFAKDFEFSEYGELSAVASRTQDSANIFANRFKIDKAYPSYEALYRDDDIDAVYIATPHNFHFQNSKQAINQGKAVLCEKPMTISSGSAIELINFAKAHRVYLMEGMWTYFLPAILKAQEWIKDGRIGELVQVKADFGFVANYDPKHRLYNPDLAGGAVWDLGIYPIAVACLLISGMPDKMKIIGHRASTGVDDEVSMLFEYGSQSANLSASFRSLMGNELYILGTKATIRIPDFWRARECYLFDRNDQLDHFEDGRASIGYNYEIEAMSKDLIAGKTEPSIVTHDRSIQLQRLMEKVLTEV